MIPRRAISSIILVIALIAGSIAYTAFITRRITNEPETVADAAGEVIGQPAIRDQMVDEIAAEILAFIGPGFTEAATAAGLDPAAEARAIAQDAVETPEYEAAVYRTLVELHEMTFVGPTGKLFIDIAGVTAAARAAAIERNPLYGPMFPDDAELLVRSPVDQVPDLSGLKSRVNDVYGTSLMIALIGIAAAFALHDRRHRVLRRIGIWAMLLAAGHLFVSWVLPSLADIYVDERDDVPIGETLTQTVGTFVRAPAITMFITGIVLIALSFVWQASAGSRRFVGARTGRAVDAPPTNDAGFAPPPQQMPPPPQQVPPPPAGYPTTQAYPAAPPTRTPPPPPPAAAPDVSGDAQTAIDTPAATPTVRADDTIGIPLPTGPDDPSEGDSVFSD